MKKRGLSQVITTLLLILLVLAAVMIVWAVVRNMIEEGTQDITLTAFTIDLEIKQVTINPNDIEVTVKRNPGEGEISGINFVISNGATSESIKVENVVLNELDTKTYSLTYDGFVKSVAIQPMLDVGGGEYTLGEEEDVVTYTDLEAINNMQGLVSWWKFESIEGINTLDEMRLNNAGVLEAIITTGKFENALEFDGTNDYAEVISPGQGLEFDNDLTVAAWVKTDCSNCNQSVMDKFNGTHGFFLRIFYDNFQFLVRNGDGTNYNVYVNKAPYIGSWTHLVGVADSSVSEVRFYLNGESEGTVTGYYAPVLNYRLFLGRTGSQANNLFWNGTIDEVMIFNKSLSDDDVRALYNLDLS